MAARILPVGFIWRLVEVVDDDGVAERRMAMVPLPRYAKVCKRQFVENEEYLLAPIEARSRASHSHLFAALHDGWSNLPEDEAKRFPTAEHLRKFLLVKTGFCDEKNYVCENHEKAMDLSAIIRSVSDYAVITVRGNVVRIYEAKSQSAAAMGKTEFEASKKAILTELEHMLGVGRGTLNKEAGRAA